MQLLLNGLLEFCETLHSCSILPADVHEGIRLRLQGRLPHSNTTEEMPPLEGDEDDASRMEEVD